VRLPRWMDARVRALTGTARHRPVRHSALHTPHRQAARSPPQGGARDREGVVPLPPPPQQQRPTSTGCLATQISSWTNEGLETIIFASQGDMRHALNNLQATVAGLGSVTAENVLKACLPRAARPLCAPLKAACAQVVDQPHPVLVKSVVMSCSMWARARPPRPPLTVAAAETSTRRCETCNVAAALVTRQLDVSTDVPRAALHRQGYAAIDIIGTIFRCARGRFAPTAD
jgi:hypothetical protein